jgi:hypothetical protein
MQKCHIETGEVSLPVKHGTYVASSGLLLATTFWAPVQFSIANSSILLRIANSFSGRMWNQEHMMRPMFFAKWKVVKQRH